MKNSFDQLKLIQSTPLEVNGKQPGTVNDSRGAVVCMCLDSGTASKSQRAAFIVKSANLVVPLSDALKIAVSVIEDSGIKVPTYCREVLKKIKTNPMTPPTSTQQKAAHSEIHVPKDWADRAAREVSSTIVGQSSDRERRIAEAFRRHSPHEALVEALKLCEKQLDDCQRTFRDLGYPVTASVLDHPLEQVRTTLRQVTA